MGAFISLMSSSFAYEDPLIRQQQQAAGAISTTAKAREIFTEMGRGMWRSGKGFAKVTVLFAGTECVIESVSFPLGTNPRILTRCGFANSLLSLRFHSFTRNVLPIDLNVLRISLYAQYRARNDIGNAVAAGFIAGGVLARNTGPKGALWGGLGFAAFSAAIDLFLRRETPE